MSSNNGFEARRYDSTITAVNLSSSGTDWRRAFTCSGVSPVYGVMNPVMYMSEREVSREARKGMLFGFTIVGRGLGADVLHERDELGEVVRVRRILRLSLREREHG